MEDLEIELFIPGELKEQPIICTMIKNFNIALKIIEASFSTESGWAFLIVNGDKSEVDRLFAYLTELGVNVEIRSK